ncbi:MAG: bifunctional methylenetetrahydrofolate dehydrogenase/methenyltetrahydrofolate cyclohydrolase FolD [Acidobacteria bacterium]|nr:bifunctional methylenetetrahydrofolate dehydrogenase/methenyltetrahydrofolate cyclohydrolase FolD [Acidobacteriota bacterium]
MTARKLDGTAIGRAIKEEVKKEVEALAESGIRPGLAAVLVGDNPGSRVYVNSKVKTCAELGLYSRKIELPGETTTAQLLELINSLNGDESIDGILVQLPLPNAIDTNAVLEAVRPEKDVDGFHPVNVGRLVRGQACLEPCTPAGIMEMLRRSGLPISGKRAVVVGRSDIVGKPMAFMLLHRHATVTICHSRTKDLPGVCREADILIAAIGRTAMITGDFVKPGAVVIDVGMNKAETREEAERIFGPDEARLAEIGKKGYTLVGDVEPRTVAPIAGYLSPVPGGVGPLTIAMLMSNTVKAARLRRRLA